MCRLHLVPVKNSTIALFEMRSLFKIRQSSLDLFLGILQPRDFPKVGFTEGQITSPNSIHDFNDF